MSLVSLAEEYFECVAGCLEAVSQTEKERRKKKYKDCIAGCRSRYIEDVKDVVNKAFAEVADPLRSHILWVSEGLAGHGRSVGIVEAELVERAFVRGGPSLPLLELPVGMHPLFLVPFIPGSSLKGLVRSMFLDYAVSSLGVEEAEAERCGRVLFGSAGDSWGRSGYGVGVVGFLDAYPVSSGAEGLLAGEVLTPHYKKEKENERVRSEIEASPRPIVGVAVGRGTRFLIVFYVDGARWPRGGGECRALLERVNLEPVPRGLALFVAGLLLRGLEYAGCCGKSGRGFGGFSVRSFRIISRPQ